MTAETRSLWGRIWRWLTEETPQQRDYRIRTARAGMELDEYMERQWKDSPW